MAGAGRIKAPTPIVHGTIDVCCSPENARQLYEALSTRKAYREI
jgi:dipeptidyl aminopeptidase/acylaminoacyl peptidase